MAENPPRVFEKIKIYNFNGIALQNNIEAELKIFSPFEESKGAKEPFKQKQKMKWEKSPAGFSPKSNNQFY